MHFSAPSHPLIYAFLLRREVFHDTERLIVETRGQGEKLLQTLEALEAIQSLKDKRQNKRFRLITTLVDILEVEHDSDLIGIFPIGTLDWRVDQKEIHNYCLDLQKWTKYNEEKLISWLTEHGYTARKSDEIGTYFRAGDTVSLPLKKGILRVSFFGTMLEDLFLDDVSITSARIYSQLPSLPEGQIS
jgi:excinuclease UvrABC helicase subunit UvrB